MPTDVHAELPLPASDHRTDDAVPRTPLGTVDRAALQERALRPMQNAELRAFEAAEERAEALIAEGEASDVEEPEWLSEGRRERRREDIDRAADEEYLRRLER